jgi:glutathione peroxidase-family protein
MSFAYDIKISSIAGEEDMLSQLKGKISLFVNISSKCGYSPKCSRLWSYARTSRQLWELQQVHDEFKDRGFSVVGFPCNQFGDMEPRSNREIYPFITNNYPFVTFPISEKIDVNGPNEHPLYSYLKGPELRNSNDNMADTSDAAKKGQNLAMQAMMRIPHNWEKFLISRDGVFISRFNWQDWPLADKPLAHGAGWTIREAIDSVL